jgi:hypothetical protein
MLATRYAEAHLYDRRKAAALSNFKAADHKLIRSETTCVAILSVIIPVVFFNNIINDDPSTQLLIVIITWKIKEPEDGSRRNM